MELSGVRRLAERVLSPPREEMGFAVLFCVASGATGFEPHCATGIIVIDIGSANLLVGGVEVSD